MNILKDKNFIRFLVRFISVFLLCYFGTQMVIGLAEPGGLYSPFIDQWLDFVSWIKVSLMKGAALVASIFGYSTIEEPGFLVRAIGRRGVIISHSCVGYGVMSFWIAFVMAGTDPAKKKIIWLLSGLLTLWLINVIRIGLFLVAINKGWAIPLGLDHHTWFNMFAYLAIFSMMYLYERRSKEPQRHRDTKKAQREEWTLEDRTRESMDHRP